MSNWLRSGFFALLEKGSGLVFALGTAMVLLRGLSKEDFTTWGIFLIITYFLEMGRSGLIQNGLMTFWAKSPTQRAEMSAAALWISLAFSVCTNLILWGSMSWLANTYHAPQLTQLLPIYCITNFVLAGMYHCNFVQQAAGEFRGIFWSTFFMRGTLFFWVIGCFFTHTTLILNHLALALLVGSLLGMLASWWVARPHLHYHWVLDKHWGLRLIAYGKYVLGTNLSTMFYKNIDKLTLGQLIGPAAFAIYDAAGKITQMVEAPSFSIAAVVFPQSAQRMAEQGSAGVKWLYEHSVAAILAIILPFVVLSILFAEPLVLVFAGPAYAESANILRLTAFFGLFMPFAVQFGTILDSTGRPATNFGYTLFTAILNLILSYILVHQYGLFGAAYATLLSYALSFVLMQRLLLHDFEIQWWRAFLLVPEMYIKAFKIIKNR